MPLEGGVTVYCWEGQRKPVGGRSGEGGVREGECNNWQDFASVTSRSSKPFETNMLL
jgi:hypothetical protein